MIRMGRSSKPEPAPKPEPAADFTKQNQPYNYSYQNGEVPRERENTQYTNRAMSESESMARDIKEGRLSGFVGSGTVLTGETTFKAMLRIDGHVTGRVISDSGTLIIGTTGHVDANVAVAAAVIHGTVNGDVIATERLELGRSAKVTGNIQTPSLMMEPGAILEGNCSMIKQRAELENKKQQKARQNEMQQNAHESEIEIQPELQTNPETAIA